MQHYLSRRSTLVSLAGVACVVASGAMASYAITTLAGTKTGVALAIIAIGGPIMIYAAIVAPIVFPFGLYVLAIPFDNLLDLFAFGTLTKLLAIASGAAILLYLARTKKAVAPPRALFFWIALYVWAAASTFWAIDQGSVFTALITSIELLVLYGAVSVFPANQRAVKWISSATVIGGVLAAAYGAYLFHNGTDIYYGTGRLRITTDTSAIDPNQFAAALLLPIVLCVTTLLQTRKWFVAIINGAALVMLLVGVALSQSRGGVMAIAAMLVYLFVRSYSRLRLAAVTLSLLLFAGLSSSQTPLWTRFGQALSTGGAGRTSIWLVALTALKSHWLLGAGYNNFPFAYDQAYLQTGHQMWGEASWHRGSHDLLLGTSVELGIVGVILLLAAWISQFGVLKDIRRVDSDYPMRVALEAAVLGTFVAALFLDVMLFKYVWLTFMLMALVRNAHYAHRTVHA
jgi:O-antigen ligase